MSYIEAIISGIVQGLTEFLPISSSGHLVILHKYLGYNEPQIMFDIFLHVGTLFAVLVYFWRYILRVITSEHRLLGFIIAASFITACIGFIFKDIFESLFSSIKMVGLMLLVTSGFLFAGEWVSRQRQDNKISQLNWFKALIIGIVQGISIIPGISRSGSTISTGLLLGLDKKEVVRFSFLLSIPAICGALLLKLVQATTEFTFTAAMLAGMVAAFLVGLGAIRILIKAVIDGKLKIFAIYCLIAGLIIIILH